jgi:hypothetical protein
MKTYVVWVKDDGSSPGRYLGVECHVISDNNNLHLCNIDGEDLVVFNNKNWELFKVEKE